MILPSTLLLLAQAVYIQASSEMWKPAYNTPMRVYETVRQSVEKDPSMKYTQCQTSGSEPMIVGLDSTNFGTIHDGLMPEICGKYVRLEANGRVVHAKATDRIWQNAGRKYGFGSLSSPVTSGFGGKNAYVALHQVDVSVDVHQALGGRLNPDGTGINIGPEMNSGKRAIVKMTICPVRGVKC